MAKKEKENICVGLDPIELAKQAEKIGRELDNPVVNLDRASYVTGTVSFGSLCIDLLTGGGLPPGKITDVYGPEASGKTTILIHTMSNSMKSNIPCFFFDHESSADGMYLNALRVRIRLDDGTRNPLFNYFQPTTGESTYRAINRILDVLPDYTAMDGGRPLPTANFFVDSLAAMLPESMEENDENNPMASGGRLHSIGLRQIKSKLGRKNCSLLCTNQLRQKPGVSFGNPEYEPGGEATKFYPDLKIRIGSKGKPFEERGRQMRFVTIRTPKNKQFVPFLSIPDETLAIAFGRGFERGYDGYGYLTLTGQIVRNGSWYTIDMANGGSEKCHWDDLMTICCTNEFRALCQAQINSGEAFNKYFKSMNWAELYKFNEEDPGDLSVKKEELAAVEEEPFDPETGEVLARQLA